MEWQSAVKNINAIIDAVIKGFFQDQYLRKSHQKNESSEEVCLKLSLDHPVQVS